MIIRIIQAVLVAMFLSILGYLLGRLVGSALQSRLEEKANLKVVRDTVLRRAKLERSLEARVRSRRTDLRQIDNRIKELVRQRLELEGQLREATAVGDRILRVIGEEVVGKPHFLALVYNKYIAGGGGAAANQTLIDPAWAIPQEIEVWTSGISEARAEVEKRYPPSFGYSVSRITLAGDIAEPGA